MLTIEIKDQNGQVVYTSTAPARTFKNGAKKGFGAYDKVMIGGVRHQLTMNITEILAKAAKA